MGKKIKNLDSIGFWKSDNSSRYYQKPSVLSNDSFDENTVIRTVKARLMILRKKRSSQNLRQFPNKGNGFDV